MINWITLYTNSKKPIYKMDVDYRDKAMIMANLRSSFRMGVGSIMSLRGMYFKVPQSSCNTDAHAIAEDWARVGKHIKSSMEKVKL